MLFAVLFAFWRFMEIITLIPTMGMLAYFVNGYSSNNLLTPTYILLLFIVSVLGLVWALFTLFSYHRSSSNARFVALVDLGFVGALIAGVYYLGFIGRANCTTITFGSDFDVSFVDVSVDKTCAMLKACFAFGIMNCIFFFVTSLLAYFHADRAAAATPSEKRYSYHESRHRRGGGGSRSSSHRHHSRSASRHGSRSRRSSYSRPHV